MVVRRWCANGPGFRGPTPLDSACRVNDSWDLDCRVERAGVMLEVSTCSHRHDLTQPRYMEPSSPLLPLHRLRCIPSGIA